MEACDTAMNPDIMQTKEKASFMGAFFGVNFMQITAAHEGLAMTIQSIN